jgi:hypothetical protein
MGKITSYLAKVNGIMACVAQAAATSGDNELSTKTSMPIHERQFAFTQGLGGESQSLADVF